MFVLIHGKNTINSDLLSGSYEDIHFEIKGNYYYVYHPLTKVYYQSLSVINPDSVIFDQDNFINFLKWLDSKQ